MEKVKQVMDKGVVVRIWQLVLVGAIQLGSAALLGTWWTAKLDCRVMANTTTIVRHDALIHEHANELEVIGNSRFKDSDGARLTSDVLANTSAIAVVKNNQQHTDRTITEIKADIKEINAGITQLLQRVP